MFGKKEMRERLINNLNLYKIKKLKKCIEIELPVILEFNQLCLMLRLYPTDDGYYVSDGGYNFEDTLNNAKYYYDSFMKNDKNYHYDIKEDNDYIYKKYPADYSARWALYEFIKFFIYFNDYILDNLDY